MKKEPKNRHKCKICDKEYNSRGGLKYHYKTKHEKEGEELDKLMKIKTFETQTKEQTKELLLKALEKTCGVSGVACQMVGIHRSTFTNWYNSDETFREAVDETRELAVDFVESKLYNLIDNGDTAATIFYLKTKGRHRGYIEKIETETTHKVEQFVIEPALPPAEPVVKISPVEDGETGKTKKDNSKKD